MRWFKHFTDQRSRKEQLQIVWKLGAEGYGIYSIVQEMIAENMDDDKDVSLELPAKVWAKSCGVSVKKFQKFAGILTDFDGFNVVLSGQSIKIWDYKLLKCLDEYTEKSRQRKQNVPQEDRGKREEDRGQRKEDREIPPASKPKRTVPKNPKPKPDTNPDIKAFIDWYFDEHLERFGTKLMINGGQDAATVKRMLGSIGVDDLKVRAERFLADPKSWPDGDKSIKFLAQNINRYKEEKCDGGREDVDYDALGAPPKRREPDAM